MTVPDVPLPPGVRIRLREPVRGFYLWTAHHASSAEAIGKLEAFITAHNHTYCLQDFSVAEAWRKKSIGSTLLANALTLLHGLKHPVYLEVERSNTDAQRLYKRMGGRRDDTDSPTYFTYYFPVRQPALAALV